MGTPYRISPPAETLLTLDEVKDYLNITHTESDVRLQSHIAAAEAYLDGYSGIMGRCLITQVWAMKLREWPCRVLRLPFPDVQSVSITYLDEDAVEQAYTADDFDLVQVHGRSEIWWTHTAQRPAVLERGMPITVEMTAGYGDRTDVPESIRLAALMLVAAWDREDVVVQSRAFELPFGFTSLTAPHRAVKA